MKRALVLFLCAIMLNAVVGAGELLVKYPGVEIDLDAKEVRVAARLSPELGWGEPVLEFILMRGAERGYETLFLTSADPVHLQLGLIMLGMKPWAFPAHPGVEKAAPENAAAFAEVRVAWDAPGGPRVEPLDFFLTHRRDKKRARPLTLLFNGSYYYADDEGKNFFAASQSGIFIAVLRNPAALFNLPYFEPSPYGEAIAGFGARIADWAPELRATRKMEVADREGIAREVERVIPADKEVTVIFRPVSADSDVEKMMRDPHDETNSDH